MPLFCTNKIHNEWRLNRNSTKQNGKTLFTLSPVSVFPPIHFGFLVVVMVTPGTQSHDKLSRLDDSGWGESCMEWSISKDPRSPLRQNRSRTPRERTAHKRVLHQVLNVTGWQWGLSWPMLFLRTAFINVASFNVAWRSQVWQGPSASAQSMDCEEFFSAPVRYSNVLISEKVHNI